MDEVRLALDAISKKPDQRQCKFEVPQEMSMPKSLFKPRVLSLGPIHHGLPELHAMEEHKKWYALRFVERSEKPISIFIQGIEKISKNLLDLYHGANLPRYLREDHRKFTEMMFTDGAFLIEFLLRLHFRKWEAGDRTSKKRWNVIELDILLLENQLPILLLGKLYDTSLLKVKYSHLSIENLIGTFLVQSELLWNKGVIRDTFKVDVSRNPDFHMLDILSSSMALPRTSWIPRKTVIVLTFPSSPTISKLHRAGLKFRSSSRTEVEIRFVLGVLHIPTLIINENTERLLANVLAYEMWSNDVHHVSDYVAMMDFLVDGPEDIKLLVKHGIIKNYLKDDEAASNLINYLDRNITIYESFSYSHLIEKLNKYCTTSRAKWQAEIFEWKMDLKRNYIGNPWKLLSVIAAVILLILTSIQTVCSILQLK